MKLNIEQEGSLDFTALVLFHGWGFDGQVWKSLLPELKKFSNVYLVDLPGFGHSDYMDWERFKTELLQQLPLKFVTVGWSLGGSYALRLAIELPHRVSHFVLVAASPKYIAQGDWPGITEQGFDHFMSRFRVNPEQTLRDFVSLQRSKSSVEIGKTASQEGLMAGLEILKFWDLRPHLAQLKRGSFLFGRLDSIVPIRTQEVMQARYAQFDYKVINRAAHLPFLSHPAVCIEYLREKVLSLSQLSLS